MIAGHIMRSVGYFRYNFVLLGAKSFLGLVTLFPKSIIEIVITAGLRAR